MVPSSSLTYITVYFKLRKKNPCKFMHLDFYPKMFKYNLHDIMQYLPTK